MKRRSFLAWLSSLAIARVVLGSFGCRSEPKGESRQPEKKEAKRSWKSFTSAQAVTARAVLERLLPSAVPTGAPGAADADVLSYLDRQLTEPHFKGFRRLIRDGFKYVNVVARKLGEKAFHELSPELQDEVLRRFQLDSVPEVRFPAKRFFIVLQSFALEGFLGDPKYGGNHDKVAWKWLGIDPTCRSMVGHCE